MLSSDPAGLLRALRIGLVVAAAGILAACTVQPLYAPTPSGASVVTTFNKITIDPVDTRVAQELRNKLIFDLSGGAPEPVAAAYRMRLVVSSTESALGITPIEAAPAYSLTVSATYEITNIVTGDIVLRGTSRGTASFDRINQVYANTRARLDAEDRAAAEAADDIRIRVATAVARGTLS